MKLNFFIISILIQIVLNAQDPNSNWVLGYNNIPPPSIDGRVILNFNSDTFKIIPTQGGHKFRMGFTNSSYSDRAGNILFYFDGFNLGNKLHNIVENGDTLNPGSYWLEYKDAFYPISNASLFLNLNENDDLLYLIHKRKEWDTLGNRGYSDRLYYSLINVKDNGGFGRVIIKNKIILKGDLIPSQMAVCKHANGRYWWIINHDYWKSIYYKVLFTDTGFVSLPAQEIGISSVDWSDNGNLLFSNDGRHLFRSSITDHLQINDFDRCSGEFSNFRSISIPNLNIARTIKICISPNDRFLYALTNDRIYQFDLESNDVANSVDTIAKWDGFIYDTFFTTEYYDMQLAPNGKIYVSCASGNVYLHTINNPNKKGLACDFKHRAIKLPIYMAIGLPNFANFDLGPEKGSVCDSLTSTYNSKLENSFTVFPNPSNGKLQIVNQTLNYSRLTEIVIIDISGSVIIRKNLVSYHKNWEFDFSYLNPGLYFIKFYQDHQLTQTSKWLMY